MIIDPYLIVPIGPVQDAYSWRFKTYEEAKSGAFEMARKHNTEVLVCKIMGKFTVEPQYTVNDSTQ